MKLQELRQTSGLVLSEDESKPQVIKALRMLKFSLRTGENSLGIDLSKIKCEFFVSPNVVYIGKPGALKEKQRYSFENAEKPGFMADRNMKLGSNGYAITGVLKTLEDAIKFIKSNRDPSIIIDPSFTKGSKPAEAKSSDAPANEDDGYFVLGYWSNAYSRSNDKEYFWSGPYYERKNAVEFGKRKQDRGQPKNFRDWVKGTSSIIRGKDKFIAAAKKANLNPNVKELYWKDE
jgi:hypothetical protein